jgi:hypothetical protein
MKWDKRKMVVKTNMKAIVRNNKYIQILIIKTNFKMHSLSSIYFVNHLYML